MAKGGVCDEVDRRRFPFSAQIMVTIATERALFFLLSFLPPFLKTARADGEIVRCCIDKPCRRLSNRAFLPSIPFHLPRPFSLFRSSSGALAPPPNHSLTLSHLIASRRLARPQIFFFFGGGDVTIASFLSFFFFFSLPFFLLFPFLFGFSTLASGRRGKEGERKQKKTDNAGWSRSGRNS